MSRVNIIIPVWNVKMVLVERCISSILENDFNDLKILLIDDGNENDYAKQLDDVALRDHRIHVEHCPHAGVSAARNYGLSISDSDYIAFVDADDEVSKEYLNSGVDLMDHNLDVDVVCGGVIYKHEDEPQNNCSYTCKENIIFTGSQLNDIASYSICETSENTLAALDGYMIAGVCCKLYRASCLRNFRFDTSLKINEDRLFNANIFMNINKVAFIKDIWYIYYQYSSSTMHHYSPGKLSEFSISVEAFNELLKQYPQLRASVSKLYISMLLTSFYLDVFNEQSNESFLQKIGRVKDILASETWKCASKNFSFMLLPLHNRITAFMAIHKMTLPLITYYLTAMNIRKLISK